jgi:hypothetical protein
VIRVVVLVPVLGRPERAQPLVESLVSSYTGKLFGLRALFLVSPSDYEQRNAVAKACYAWPDHCNILQVEWEPGPGDYARKINRGWRHECGGPTDFVFLGADDLDFQPGWIEQAVSVQLDTGACVIGTNDLGSPATERGTASTHSLVHVGYTCGTADDPDPGLLLHEGYDHNFVDNEFVATARARGLYAHAPHARVEHLHPIHRKADDDATYAKGQARFAEDRLLFRARKPLWGDRDA